MGCDERMYLRYTTRKKDGKVHRYWRLVRSVRVGRRVIQQTVAQLGELDARGRLQARALARQLIGEPEQAGLFDDGQQHMTVPVRLKGVRVERSRQFGDVYLALALWRGTGWPICARSCCRRARKRCRGRRWRRCWWRRGCASRRASCTSPRTGTGARRFAICCSSMPIWSTRIGCIARSTCCWSTRRSWRRICRDAAASCSRSTTRCCCTT